MLSIYLQLRVVCVFALGILTTVFAGPVIQPDDVQVERVAENQLMLSWNAEKGAVNIYMAATPEADASMQLLAESDENGTLKVNIPEEITRPYFYIQPVGSESGYWVAERLLPLEGGRNFRDLGGYPTESGKTTRWGVMYRSGVLAGLTDPDYTYLADLDIAVVCDLRDSNERAYEATVWRGGKAPQIIAWGYADSGEDGSLSEFLEKGVTPEAMRQVMIGLYHEIAYDHADKYATMFRRLAAGETPLLFHCSAGKDRAGTGAALLLSALGVPRSVIVADYAMSEKVVDYEAAYAMTDEDEDRPYAALAKLPAEVRRPLLRSDPAYIEAMFASIEENHGSVEGFFSEVMGIEAETLERMRARLLY